MEAPAAVVVETENDTACFRRLTGLTVVEVLLMAMSSSDWVPERCGGKGVGGMVPDIRGCLLLMMTVVPEMLTSLKAQTKKMQLETNNILSDILIRRKTNSSNKKVCLGINMVRKVRY